MPMLLGSLSVSEFLSRHWQRQPLFVPGAWPGFDPPLTPGELAGLACEHGPTARLVLGRAERPWALRHGPFDEVDFTALPRSHWTLLVSDVEKWLPELRDIVEPFRFLPDWRIDDLMVSYAAPQGSVGPHVDRYDVFLLQGRGQRRWQIAGAVAPDVERVPGTELDILARFEPEAEWIAEPGDLLYLPPGVAHHGIALDECMTFSIGFRAPSRQELLLGLLESLALEADPEIRYRDPGLAPQPSPGWIAEDAIDRVQALVRQGLSLDRENIRRWFGRFVTEPKPELEDLRPDNPELEPPELLEAWRESGFIDRAQAARLALSGGDERLWLFADGEAFQLAPHLREAAETLCALHRYPIGCFEPWLGDNDFTDLVTALYRHGAVSLDDD